MARLFKKFGRFSGYFKKTQEYIEKSKPKKKALTKEEQNAIINDDRYCLHWGCEKIYREVDNTDKKPCLFHPGRWDFGHTGVTITQALEDKSTILWGPHWTCCRRGWRAKGCARGVHSGPSLKACEGAVKKFKWPDPRAQVYFKKRISPHWKNFLSKYTLDDPKAVEAVFHYFASTKGSEGKIPLTLLPMLLDRLKLHLLVLSEDLSFHFKYLQVMRGKVAAILDDGDGNVDKTKFVNWWTMGLEELLKFIESDEDNYLDEVNEG